MYLNLNLDKKLMGAILIVALSAPAAADLNAYVTDTTDFGTINLANGQFTEIGTLTTTLSGLGEASDGTLYGGLNGGNVLYQVNSTTGALTDMGHGSINYFDTGSTTSAIYAMDSALNLYSVNTSTGATTLVGPTGLSFAGGYAGMSTGSGTLYFTNGASAYTINTNTGAATLLGPHGTNGIGAMVFEAGQLYAGAINPQEIYSLNTTTGAGTLVTTSNFPAAFYGLAPIATPEPSVLAALSVGALALLRRRKAR